jgi:2-iminobutanoate/2-iminopropanoate deaminase
MEKVRVQTDSAPAAVGPYSQGITLGDLVFCAGQAAIDPATRQLVGGGIEGQTRRVMENLRAVLEAAGSDFDHVLKSNVYLTEMSTFKAMNEVYGSYFTGTPPARTTVGVKELPLGAIVEIEMIASKK